VVVLQFPQRYRRYVAERVDLAVRVRDRGADLRTAVFEDEHVGYVWPGTESGGALCPERNDEAELVTVQGAQRLVVLW
jgi:hypothetical protein